MVGKLHLWLGLSSGLVVFILGITGCVYVFIDEIKPMVYKDRIYVEVPTSTMKLPVSVLREKAQTALGEKYPLNRMLVSSGPDKTYVFLAMKSNKKALSYPGSLDYYYTVFVNPYSGAITKIENSKYEFFRIIFSIHWSLLLSTEIGQPIVGIAVIIFVIQLIAGLILWWPKSKNALKQRLWFRWKSSNRWKRKNYDLHNIPGFYSLFFALIIALTGLVWAFDWFNDSVQWLANTGKTIEKSKLLLSDTTKEGIFLPLDKILLSEQIRHPGADSYSVSFPSDNKATVRASARLDKHSYFQSINTQYDQYTGKLIKTTCFADKNAGEKLSALNYDIHVGGVFGLPGKILACVVSLICASLPVTGFYIWMGRRKRNLI